jgi:transposase-like protein
MVGFDQPTSRQERREWWRRQLSRQQAEKISVTEFCRQLGIHFSTYYYWKKRAQQAPSSKPGQIIVRPPIPPVSMATNFIPVSLVDRRADAHLEIELANACVVRLQGAIDPSMLQAAIIAAGQLDGLGRRAN